MRIREATQKTVAIYPGRFHPFHKGHASVYNFLKSKFDTVYITTSNKIDPPKSPFSFEEKRAMMIHAGIPASAIVQTRQPYIPIEILKNFDPQNTSVVFAVSQKDMDEDPRFAFKPKKDGSPSYFQPAAGADMEGLDKHGYVMVAPTLNFTVLGEPMKSATEFRRDFAAADDEKQAAMITDLYGSYSKEIHNIMRNKIKEHADPYMAHVLAAESVLHDLNVLYEHRSFDMSHVALNAQKIIDRINTIPVVETLDYLDPNDPMDSIVAVPGVGTMSIRGLMSNIKDKMSELADKAGSGQPSSFRDIKYRLDSNIIGVMVDALANAFDEIETIRRKGGKNSAGIPKNVFDSVMHFHEAWSAKYKRSINCNNPRGFSQRAHCQGRNKNEDIVQEYVFQSIPLRVLDNLASRKDNRPFPIKTGPDSTFDVTPEIARKFMNVYLRKEPEVQKAIDKTLNDPRRFIELFTDIMAGRTRSGAKVTDVAPDKIQEFKIVTPDAKDTMGIARKDMPQVNSADYPEFLEYLSDAGAKFTKETVPAKSLRAIQGEFSKKGVEKQLNKYMDGTPKKPVIASSDDYIIDGHHRWLVATNTGDSVEIFRVNMPSKQLLDLVNAFPKVTYKDIYSEGYKLQLERGDDMDVLHITDTKTGQRTEVRGKPNYETQYDADDRLHQLLDKIGKAANISELINGEPVGINPKHPDGASSKAATTSAFNESAGVGIIDAQNTTADVKPGETERQSRKLGLGGKPKLLHKKAAKNSTPNKLFNLGIAEIYTPLAIAIMEGGHELPNFAEVDEGAIDDIISINKKLQAQRDAREAGLKDKLIKMLVKARGLPRGSDQQVELIKDMNKIRKQLMMDPIAIPEGAEITMWTNPEYQGSDVDDVPIKEAPKDRDSMNLDADKLQQSIDYFYTTHAPKNFGSATTEGNFKGLKVVTFTKGSDTLMFLVDNDDQAVFYVMYSKFDDGVAIGNVRSNGTVKATEVYAYLVDKFGTLYSDDSQTPQGRKIWTSLAKFYPNLDVKDTGGRFVATLAEAVSQVDIDQLERFADKMFAKVGIDVEFGRHFMDRVNDARNGKPITPAELTRLFKQEYKRYGKPIAQMGPEQQAVMKDLQTDINIPFMLQWDDENNELDLIAKTVMRKKDFKTSNREFAVERGGINVPFASGMIAQIVPHRALKVKKSTPGRLSYDQPETKRKRNN